MRDEGGKPGRRRMNRFPGAEAESLGPERRRTAAVTALILFAVAGISYLCSPLDLIPDTIPLAGWLDDLVAMLLSSAGAVVSASYLQGYELREWRRWAPALIRGRAWRWGVAIAAIVLLIVLALAVLAAAVVWSLLIAGQTRLT